MLNRVLSIFLSFEQLFYGLRQHFPALVIFFPVLRNASSPWAYFSLCWSSFSVCCAMRPRVGVLCAVLILYFADVVHNVHVLSQLCAVLVIFFRLLSNASPSCRTLRCVCRLFRRCCLLCPWVGSTLRRVGHLWRPCWAFCRVLGLIALCWSSFPGCCPTFPRFVHVFRPVGQGFP